MSIELKAVAVDVIEARFMELMVQNGASCPKSEATFWAVVRTHQQVTTEFGEAAITAWLRSAESQREVSA